LVAVVCFSFRKAGVSGPAAVKLFRADCSATEAFSVAAFSAAAFSAATFSTTAFSVEIFSAAAFSAEAFSAVAFSAEAFSAAAFSAAAFSAETFSAAAFSAAAFSIAVFSAAAFSAETFSADVCVEVTADELPTVASVILPVSLVQPGVTEAFSTVPVGNTPRISKSFAVSFAMGIPSMSTDGTSSLIPCFSKAPLLLLLDELSIARIFRPVPSLVT
jgi:hypothetical protein